MSKPKPRSKSQIADDIAKKLFKELNKKLQSQTKRYNKIDIESNRGAGSVVAKGGKSRPVSEGRAAAGRSTAGAMSSRIGKENAADIAKGEKLKKKIDTAKTPEAKLKARREYRQWRKDTGR
jgi:hypothetical protein